MSVCKSEFEILINNDPQGYEAENKKKYKFSCELFPEFNVSNLVFAICSIGFDEFDDDSINDLSFLKLPKGRLDFIEGIPVNIIIDFAHNEHSFNILLNSIKRYFDNLIVVFGCGGDRDKIKRSKMLKAAIENASKIIFTSDNSRSENFEDIYEDAKYDNDLKDVIVIEDRKEAIIQGSKLINDNDCMLILGKGHEETQEINGIISHFSDYEVIHEIYS
jgi:UDP-N-acetylmuramyl tripeptide synthase